jgi:hypothetical protein
MELPLFMIEEVYGVMDEFIEEDKKRMQSINQKI